MNGGILFVGAGLLLIILLSVDIAMTVLLLHAAGGPRRRADNPDNPPDVALAQPDPSAAVQPDTCCRRRVRW